MAVRKKLKKHDHETRAMDKEGIKEGDPGKDTGMRGVSGEEKKG